MTIWVIAAFAAGLMAGFLLAGLGVKSIISQFYFAVLDAGQKSRADAEAFLTALETDSRTPSFLRRHIGTVPK